MASPFPFRSRRCPKPFYSSSYHSIFQLTECNAVFLLQPTVLFAPLILFYRPPVKPERMVLFSKRLPRGVRVNIRTKGATETICSSQCSRNGFHAAQESQEERKSFGRSRARPWKRKQLSPFSTLLCKCLPSICYLPAFLSPVVRFPGVCREPSPCHCFIVCSSTRVTKFWISCVILW